MGKVRPGVDGAGDERSNPVEPAARSVRIALEFGVGPLDRGARARVEVFGTLEQRLLVVAQQAQPRHEPGHVRGVRFDERPHALQAQHGPRSVANHVPQAHEPPNAALERGVRRFVCLGDVIGYGARPVLCLERVRALVEADPAHVPGLVPGLCLLGNHEQALLEGAEDFNPRARAAIEWTHAELQRDPDGARRWFDWIGALVPSAVDARAHFAHGSPRDPVREYVVPRDARDPVKLSALFRHMQRGVCFVGHSHIPAVYFQDQRFYRPRGTDGPYQLGDTATCKVLVNVGSVGQPRDRDPRLSYVLFDGECITFIRLEYDISAAQDDILAIAGLPVELAERLASGV